MPSQMLFFTKTSMAVGKFMICKNLVLRSISYCVIMIVLNWNSVLLIDWNLLTKRSTPWSNNVIPFTLLSTELRSNWVPTRSIWAPTWNILAWLFEPKVEHFSPQPRLGTSELEFDRQFWAPPGQSFFQALAIWQAWASIIAWPNFKGVLWAFGNRAFHRFVSDLIRESLDC